MLFKEDGINGDIGGMIEEECSWRFRVIETIGMELYQVDYSLDLVEYNSISINRG
jgi:hypothetical protein